MFLFFKHIHTESEKIMVQSWCHPDWFECCFLGCLNFVAVFLTLWFQGGKMLKVRAGNLNESCCFDSHFSVVYRL